MVPPAANAQDSDPISRGRRIAERLCASCHATAPAGESSHKLAPPFRVLPSRYPVVYLAEALAEGIVVAHKDMPQFTFDPDEIEAILAFIESLAPTTPRKR